MSDKYSIYDFIKDKLPEVEGFGNVGKELVDNEFNHSVFYQTIREEHEGDVGIFIIDNKDYTEMKFIKLTESEIQVVVNCIQGDIEQTLDYLESLFKTLSNTKGNDKVEIFNCRKINLRPVGKNKNDIHWCVLNILLKYRYNNI